MNRIFVIISVTLVSISCSDNETKTPSGLQWKKLGLDGKTVNQLQLSDDKLYVATNAGLFVKKGTAEFVSLGFANKNVQAVEVMDGDKILASIYDKSGVEPPALYRTDDAGETWTLMQTDFGKGHPEPVIDLAIHPQDKNIIYATGLAVVAKSSDGGIGWQSIYGSWGGLASGISVVTLNPHEPSEVWAGGQGAIENGYLLRSRDETAWDQWTDLVDNPTVVKEISFPNSHFNEVYVGFEGALLKSINGGSSWQTLIQSDVHKFFFGVCINAENARRVYTGGWVKTSAEQPLVVHISDDGGGAWRDLSYEAEPYGGIWDMAMKTEGDHDILYLGLDKGGVYQVKIAQ